MLRFSSGIFRTVAETVGGANCVEVLLSDRKPLEEKGSFTRIFGTSGNPMAQLGDEIETLVITRARCFKIQGKLDALEKVLCICSVKALSDCTRAECWCLSHASAVAQGTVITCQLPMEKPKFGSSQKPNPLTYNTKIGMIDMLVTLTNVQTSIAISWIRMPHAYVKYNDFVTLS
jgi:hypothetical protein